MDFVLGLEGRVGLGEGRHLGPRGREACSLSADTEHGHRPTPGAAGGQASVWGSGAGELADGGPRKSRVLWYAF